MGAAVAVILIAAFGQVRSAAAQADSSLEAGGKFDALRLGELNVTSLGAGAYVKWHPTPGFAVGALISYFPGNWQRHATFRSPRQSRLLALAGVTRGIALGRIVLAARARAGVLDHRELSEPIPCLAIFPTPLECQLATGHTSLAFDLGGDADIALDRAGHMRLHAGAGDLMVRYGLNAFRRNGLVTDGFTGHNLLISAGLGWRF